jgi:hypothetical protein
MRNASGKGSGMNRTSVRMLLREVAIAVTALAFLAVGSLTMREHLFVLAGIPGPTHSLCLGNADAAPAAPDSSGKQHHTPLCQYCTACQTTLATAAPALPGPCAGRHVVRTARALPEQLSTTRPDLPPATGPPHLG